MLFGSCSRIVRVGFGNCSETVRVRFVTSSGQIRHRFDTSSGQLLDFIVLASAAAEKMSKKSQGKAEEISLFSAFSELFDTNLIRKEPYISRRIPEPANILTRFKAF